ncbi:MAG: hypothetical protein AAF085_08385 [Planctomycetota bacterium]
MRILPLTVLPIMAVVTLVLTQPWETAEAAKPIDPTNEAVICVVPVESFEGKTAEQWRAEGPEGLADLIESMQPSIKAYIKSNAHPFLIATPEQRDELAKAKADVLFIDQVAQQRDAYTSKLYWYTDLDEAIKEAKRTGKPILSLRMLGELVDEYSCANSRFFRTTLYADSGLSYFLREKFVLHWKSVRPVPVITIDMGDGRTIKRTITGNSAHYVLDSNGRVFDCIPGLYGSGTFSLVLANTYHFVSELADKDDALFMKAMHAYHRHEAGMLDTRWVNITSATRKQLDGLEAEIPDARMAGLVARGKMLVEMPLVDAVLEKSPKPTDPGVDEAVWARVAQAYASEAKLDPASKAMMRRKTVTAEDAAKITFGKARVEDPLLAMIRNFENAIALDTARNEHLLRRELCNWFIAAEGPIDFDQLNSRVYAELFLTPEEDPWLGLVPADTYSALDAGGLIK